MVAAAAVLWTALVAQAGSPAQPPAATGLIVGRVVDAGSGRPVAGAVVGIVGGGALPGREPRAMTNANGYFVFRKLAKGSYSLNATRPGYVDGAYGRRRPGGTAGQVELDEGQRVSDVVIPLWRHATITGTVMDEGGEPMIGVQVRSFQRRLTGGRYRIMQGAVATTDDRGIYRLVSLQPGDYLVAFVWRETSVPTAVADLMRSPNPADPKVQEIMRERFALGSFTGTSSGLQVGGSVRDLAFGTPVPPVPPDDGAVFIYPTQFYPGVPSAARAAAITVASGQERAGIDFSLKPVKTARVSGTLMGPDGPVANAALRLLPAGDDVVTDLDTSATMTGGGGEFTLLGVPAGQYMVKALRVPRPAAPSPSTMSMTQIQVGSSMVMSSASPGGPAPMPPVSDEPTMFAEAPVSVGTTDVTDVLLTLQRGARMSGRFEFDGTRERPEGTALMRIPISLDRVEGPSVPGVALNAPPGHADETGAFKTYGVAPGRYMVRVGSAPGWTVKSVTIEGRDVSETPMDLRTADVTNAVVTFTDRPTRLTGVARASNGNADPEAVVIVFPADQTGWTDYGFNPRRIRSTHAARNGSYTFSGLPAGDYHVTAIHDDTTPQWQDPRVLEDLARGASQVRLADGDTRTQDVKTVKGGSQ